MSDQMFGESRQRNPFSNGQEVATRQAPTLGALASAEQQRALGEIQAQIMLARMNPRDPQQAVDNILRDCGRLSLAKSAQYEYARGGTDIKGPSIKLMEAIARRWGNIHSGFKIVHTEGDTSDVVTYAWDLETGYKDDRQFQVRHIRDTRKGPVKVTDERDVYELIANASQRRKRSCLQAVIPADVIEAAVEQCEETMTANVDTSVEGLKRMLKAFTEFGVTQAQIEQRIQCRLDAISPGQMMQLSRIYTSLHDGMSQPSQWFRAVDPPRPTRTQAPQTKPAQKPSEAPVSTVVPDPKPEDQGKDIRDFLPEKKLVLDPGDPDKFLPPETTESEEVGASGSEFEHGVLNMFGEPVDGELYLDPLTWAQQFIELWNETSDEQRPVLIQQNLDALHDCSSLSPEADALLDGIIPAEPEGELPAADPLTDPDSDDIDPDERTAATILQHLPTLQTGAEVIAYSKTETVMAPIKRWQKEGRDGLVTSVKSAFTAHLENLRKAGSA